MIKVYVLVSEKISLRFYVGMTDNLERRLLEHNSSKVKSTAYYSPWKLFYYEEFTNRTEGRIREKYLKGGSGKEQIKRKWSETNHEV
jgi:putative endonuclease